MPFLRRLAFAPVVLVVVAAVTYGMPRVLRPDMFPGEAFVPGLAHDLNRVFFHLDFGCAVMLRGCPSIRELWLNGVWWDLWLLVGGVVFGASGGIFAGMWCARRPGSLPARLLEAAAMAAYCAPVFFVGLFVLWLFNPIYGRIPLPFFFDAEPRWVQPWTAPWDWFRQLLVPWIVLGAPLGAMCLRLTLSITREAMDEDFVRTAAAKGVHPHDIVRHHAAPLSFPGTFSFIGVSAPLIITNMVLVERTLNVPGFFKYTWRAAGHENLSVAARDPIPDFPLLCALALWGAVLLIVLGLIADGIVSRLDPRVRLTSGRAW
ncbi:MAG TPA: ABC transporter permease [Vicinamibacterales bacterium]|nr:ABC transporter permease [Vicinamibacterales bacterium]